MLTEAQAARIHVMAAFSEPIGNTDRHFENISLMLDARNEPRDVAPAYDILPMRYAPVGDAVPPLDPVAPSLGSIGGRTQAWSAAHAAALDLWIAVVEEGAALGLSAPMRKLAAKNRRAIEAFAKPLLAR